MIRSVLTSLSIVALGASAFACSSSTPSSPSGTSGTSGTPAGTLSVNAQTPPTTGGTAVEAWIKDGSYKSWKCEPAVHASRSPSPHGMNRICSNDLTAAFTGAGERPLGSAGVKELYDATGKEIVGVAVYVKTKATSDGGSSWYWYERVPLASAAPHDAKGVVADGLGASGPAKDICVGCHAGAGSDAAHTPTPGALDQVYTQVK